MRLVNAVLRDLDDRKTVADQGDAVLPLLAMADAYNSVAKAKPQFKEVTENTNLHDFKTAVAKLRVKDKVAVLQIYRESARVVGLFTSRAPAEDLQTPSERLAQMEAEERIRFRSLAKRVVLFLFAPIPPIIAGAMAAISWYKGVGMDSAVINSIVLTATEVLKLIFTI
jgi:hypothetical protein